MSAPSQSQPHKGTIQFGVYELKLDTGELRRNGIRVKLQGKAFQILQALLERPGEVVTREELQTRLWPGDTFVDFESGLNTAANRLRLTLGDSAENPRFIETIARAGYRFIGTVTVPMPRPSTGLLPVDVSRSRTAVLPSYRLRWLLTGVFLGAVASVVVWASRQAPDPPSFRQITFRRGVLNSARFGPDGESILYSAEWDGARKQLFLANTVSPESRALGFQDARLAGVSPSSELALLSMDTSKNYRGRTLCRVPLNGGAPLTVATGVAGADWGPDGKSLAVFRIANRESVVEYPVGKVLYRTASAISDLRVSPTGDSVAFLEHPVRADDAGLVKLVTSTGMARDLSPQWASAGGLAWSPSGKEIWFAAGETGVRRAIYRVTLDGKVRHVASLPGTLTLYDISKTGSVLLGIDRSRLVLAASSGSESTERDISWFDWSHVVELSTDGKLLLFDETGDGGGANHSIYLRNLATDSTVRLGDGQALGWSPDLKWVLALNAKKPTYLSLLPVGPEAPRALFGFGLKYNWARFFPDGQHLLVAGNFPGKSLRLFVQPVNGGEPAPLNPDVYLGAATISPDGKQIAGVGQDQKTVILPVSGGEPRALPMLFSSVPLRWSAEGKALFVRQSDAWTSIRIFRCDLATAQCRMWKELTPSDRVGLAGIMEVVISADERLFAYSYMKVLSELFVVNGWT